MLTPRVSVLLPTHNRADVLDTAVRSVLGQTMQDFELLVVGDGCTDGSKEVVEGLGDKRVRWFDLPKAPHLGYANRNVALREARGAHVAYMAHDDLWLPDHLDLLVGALDQNGTELAYSMPLWVAPDGSMAPLDFDLTDAGTLNAFLDGIRNAIPSICVAHRRECLERYGYWNEELSCAGDWNLWARIIRGGGRRNVAYVRKPSSLHFRAGWRTEANAGPSDLCVWRVLHQIPGALPPSLRQPAPEGASQQNFFWRRITEFSASWISELRAASASAAKNMSAAISPESLADGEQRANFFFNPDHLHARAVAQRSAFLEALPFPHIVIDNFLPMDVANRLRAEYPPPEKFSPETTTTEPRRKCKLRSRSEQDFSPFVRQVLDQFNSPVFTCFLQEISGIDGLVPDPDISGALRHFGRGGCLGVHADFNFHQKLQLYRRLNIILYLNKDWKPKYKGDFELWDERVTRCEKRVAPVFNRALLFTATDKCYHGFPEPLKCPAGMTRMSVQFYYYTKDPPPEGFTAVHGTVFRWRPQDIFNPDRWAHVARSLIRRILSPSR